MKSIIVYFSRNGKNYVNGTIQELAIGNTEVAAKILKKLTGADLFKLELVNPYPLDYLKCVEQVKQDLHQNARPELKTYPQSMEQYDTIYLGYPNYCGTIPMLIFTFLEKYDFSGKTIKPFCTHEGSGMGRSEQDIQKLCERAVIEKGLAIRGADVKNSENAIKQWK